MFKQLLVRYLGNQHRPGLRGPDPNAGAWRLDVLTGQRGAVQHRGRRDVRTPLYERDVAVNELERSIRRKVLRHLTVNPGHDVAICLALMSVAKDAERIGDYCKNVFEVGVFYTKA